MKKQLKKAIVLIVIAVLVLSIMAMAMSKSYAGVGYGYGGTGFSDVSYDNPFYNAISKLSADGVVDGYSDGTFKPDAIINRAEFLKIVMSGNGFTGPDVVSDANNYSNEKITIYVGDGCPHCTVVEDYVTKNKYADSLKIEYKEVYNNVANAEAFNADVKRLVLDAGAVGVPFLVVKNDNAMGDTPVIDYLDSQYSFIATDKTLSGGNCFTDVKDQWFSSYVCKAKELKYVDGYKDGSFKPSQEVTFSEASKMIANIYKLTVDDSKTEAWYQKYVFALEKANAIPASVTSFSKTLSRGEMADMIYRISSKDSYELGNTYNGLKSGKLVVASLRKFSSCEDLGGYIEKNTNRYYGYDFTAEDFDSGITPEAEAPAVSSDSKTGGSEGGGGGGAEGGDVAAEDFSSTNIQVDGVDEADIVKNDGQYIYLIKDSTIRIVKAYPPTEMKEVAEVTFSNDNFYPREMYVDGNQLIAIGGSYGVMPYITSTFAKGRDSYESTTQVYIFNITNRNKPVLDRSLVFDGYYNTSRKVGSTVYLVANKYTSYYWDYEFNKDENLVPMYSDSKTKVAAPATECSNVSYIPGATTSNYMTVSAIPLNALSSKIETEVVMGYSGNVFASTDNLYVAEQYYSPVLWDSRTGEYGEETIIHKFALSSLDVSYKGSGVVKGRTLNQFSMDEHDGYLRIATTAGSTWENNSTNNLYILDSGLIVVGKVTGLAKGEEIYSSRFVGDRAYMVTFKTVDPLFVIDVADPTSPRVLGELKIPGYSDYLHPYDENHIIGFGLTAVDMTDAEAAQFGGNFAWYQGVKLAMFDVTDVAHPTEMFTQVIGDRGTYSDLQYNHKALLFDKEKGIMAFPISVAKIDDKLKLDSKNSGSTYGDQVFQGAYIYGVNLTDGFTFKGKLTHFGDFNKEYVQNYEYQKFINRILYMGNYYYTVSGYKVMANNFSDLKSAGEVVLKATEGYGGGTIEPFMGE